ncbi:MltA domain-containing protein [Luteimonas salinilitoris]
MDSPASVSSQSGAGRAARLRIALIAALWPLLAAPASAQDGGADLGRPFATRHAVFEPIGFGDLPGWNQDTLHEGADGMRQSCAALRRKQGWSTACAEFEAVDAGSDTALRGFFQRHFHAYRILSPARRADGLLTGYFEPLLEGRRDRDDVFRYPVYGLPADLLLFDASARAGGTRQWLRVQGNRLLPASAGGASAREYTLALDDITPGIRDKRLRVRIDGDHVRPYWSRQDIELRALDAPVLAWVSAPDRLYSMQVQGSGKIRLEDGSLIRVSYAEQNGHPFLPNITRGSDARMVLRAIKTRGLSAGGSSDVRSDPAISASVNDEVSRLIALFQGKGGSTPPPSPASRPAPTPSSPPKAAAATGISGNDAEVAAIIAALMGGGSASVPAPNPAPEPAPASATPPTAAATSTPPSPAGQAFAGSGGVPAALTNIPDPSYVFFRSSGDGPQGPVGALGVPLTAGRSLAVDPRSTPLGSPVFISTTDPAGNGPMRRLMFAQDTGGAIRGSVRGDLFWGFGDTAGRLALATNEVAQMWLLLPKTQVVTAAQGTGGPALRSLRSRASLPDCVIADPDLCVED